MAQFFLPISKLAAANVSPLTLAYVGDAVHSLFVRANLTLSHDSKAGELHRLASGSVNAHSQALTADSILPRLTEEEQDVFRRGRNAKSHHTAKNQTRTDYMKATGIEAVLGYLYLIGDIDRIKELLTNEN
jgi:ribonuclease-3 family protein